MATYVQTFEVTGPGTFPYDMLRYDYCYPADSESASNLEAENNGTLQQRTISLKRSVSMKTVVPTAARWNSFGWRVVQESIRTFK